MKIITLLIISTFLSLAALASEFHVTPTYCNGPISNGDTTNCPSFGNWKGVRLKDLKLVQHPVTKDDDQILVLQDSMGMIWEQDLSLCKSNYNSLRGCAVKIDYSKPNSISFFLETWDIGTQIQRLSLFLNNQNSLSISPPGGDQLVFGLE
jgi:hypothetical protein